ncbi:hypothetical protein [Aequorivita echinoideorum]|uniref:Uncharacterized protein n=1 Tax=Aequorivita echinoideorum TaxID=1549647 RepID=A0ABS5S343_9FLAO|nr:hypothetical protein [Aequorivita echinoideorum]MBT0607618.1 hypothetical protein [Aequorivita echinoideorum]
MNKKLDKCQHSKNSCPKCSRVKMVVYLKNDESKVWYSFIKEDQKLAGLDAIALKMGDRVIKKYGEPNVNKMLFYNNADPSQPAFAEN